MGKTRLTCVALIVASCLATPAQGQVKLTASVDNTRPAVGDEITYSLNVESPQGVQGAPQLPPFESIGFAMGQTGRSESSTIVNGRLLSSGVSFTLGLTVKREGSLVIPPASITVGGKKYESNPVTVEVGKPSSAGIPASLGAGEVLSARAPGDSQLTEQLRGRLFVKPVISKTSLYVREQTVVSYYMYISADIVNYFGGYGYTPFETSDKSLLITPLYQADPAKNPNDEAETLDGKQYRCFLLAQAVVFPLRAGQVALPEFRAEVALRLSRRRSLFFDDATRVNLPTKPQELTVRALPEEGKPPTFDGAVGDYTITAAVNKSAVREYDLVNLKVTVAGRGNIASVPDPSFGKMEGIEKYESKGEAKTDVKDGNFGGGKVFDIVLQPTLPGDRMIPSISYSFFNPRVGRYETVKTAPIPLKVEVDPNRKKPITVIAGATTEGGEAGGGANKVRILGGMEIRTIKTDPDVAFQPYTPIYCSLGFWLAQLAPAGLLAGAWRLGGHRRRLAADVAFARSSTARERASRRLKGAGRAIKGGDMLAFYAEAAAALRGLVADKGRMAAAGATNDELRNAVCSRTGDENLGRRLFDFLEACDAARYAPGGVDGGAERWEEAKRLVRELERRLG